MIPIAKPKKIKSTRPSRVHARQIISGRSRRRGRALTHSASVKGGITGALYIPVSTWSMHSWKPGMAPETAARCRLVTGGGRDRVGFMTSNETARESGVNCHRARHIRLTVLIQSWSNPRRGAARERREFSVPVRP